MSVYGRDSATSNRFTITFGEFFNVFQHKSPSFPRWKEHGSDINRVSTTVTASTASISLVDSRSTGPPDHHTALCSLYLAQLPHRTRFTIPTNSTSNTCSQSSSRSLISPISENSKFHAFLRVAKTLQWPVSSPNSKKTFYIYEEKVQVLLRLSTSLPETLSSWKLSRGY
jgi:hypothetical protein